MSEIADLIAVALTGDGDPAWNAIRALQERGDAEVFEASSSLLRSASARERARGVDILAQLGTPKPSDELRRRCADLILETLKQEQSVDVLHSIGVALGHLQDPRAVEALVPLRTHAEADVRYGVVLGLLPHSVPDSISALIELSADADEDVRNWATFGLGSMEGVDTPLLREALVQRLNDANAEIRGEALVGLVQRKDPRVVEPLRRELAAENVGILAVEAAGALGDLSLLPLLHALRDRAANANDYFLGVLNSAIAALQGVPTTVSGPDIRDAARLGRHGDLSGEFTVLAAHEVTAAVSLFRTIASSSRSHGVVERSMADAKPNEVREWLQSLPIASDLEVLLLWPAESRGISLSFGRFVEVYDDLWRPGADDVWIGQRSSEWLLELDHEEVFSFSRSDPVTIRPQSLN